MPLPRNPEAWVRLGARIRAERERQGLARRELAALAGVSQGSIQSAEKGTAPRGRWPQTLSAIEKALGWGPGSMRSVLEGGEVQRIFEGGDGFDFFATATDSFADATKQVNYTQPDEVSHGSISIDLDRLRSSIGKDDHSASPLAAGSPPTVMAARDVELVQSGRLAQDAFIRQAKRYRELRGLSIEQLAKKLTGKEPVLEEEDIRRLENGTRLLRMAEARAVASALETTVDWLLGSSFSTDAPEEITRPPNDKELEAEANAVRRRIADMGAQVNTARHQAEVAAEREAAAHVEAHMAMTMLQSVTTQHAEMEKQYQYLLGRIDSLRAAKGEEPAVQLHPVYEEDGQ